VDGTGIPTAAASAIGERDACSAGRDAFATAAALCVLRHPTGGATTRLATAMRAHELNREDRETKGNINPLRYTA
jgi:hypothetical protein